MSRRYDREHEPEHSYRKREEERERGFIDRAGDEVKSWFGDEEAERRRRMDDMRYGREQSRDYSRDYGRRDYTRDYGRNYDRDYSPEFGRTYGGGYSEEERRGRTGIGSYEREGWRDRWEQERGESGMDREDWMRRQGRLGLGREQSTFGGENFAHEGGPTNWMLGTGVLGRHRGQFAGRGPRNYTRSDDRIIEDINERLTRDPMVDASDIEVSCQNGDVILRGAVNDRDMKRRAEDIAEEVWGVKEVNNQIRVQQWQERTSQHAA